MTRVPGLWPMPPLVLSGLSMPLVLSTLPNHQAPTTMMLPVLSMPLGQSTPVLSKPQSLM